MCSKCDLLAAHLLLSEAEQDTVRMEQEHRLSPRAAIRPLTENELRAKVMFADVEDLLEDAASEAAQISEELHNAVREAILLALLGAKAKKTSPYEAIHALEQLVAEQPETVAAAVAAATASVAGVLNEAYAGASATVLSEAARQGVKDLPAPLVKPADELELAAKAVAAHPWQRILSKVQAELSKPAVLLGDQITREDVEAVLDTVKIDGTRDLAKQSIHTAAGMGRIDTAEELEPQEIWASEIMDGAGCNSCAKVDGRDYATLEQARQDYPLGFYQGCDGGARCRGTLVFQFA